MHNLSIPYTADPLVTSGKAPQELEEELRFLLATKSFEMHRLSLGKAAEFYVRTGTFAGSGDQSP